MTERLDSIVREISFRVYEEHTEHSDGTYCGGCGFCVCNEEHRKEMFVQALISELVEHTKDLITKQEASEQVAALVVELAKEKCEECYFDMTVYRKSISDDTGLDWFYYHLGHHDDDEQETVACTSGFIWDMVADEHFNETKGYNAAEILAQRTQNTYNDIARMLRSKDRETMPEVIVSALSLRDERRDEERLCMYLKVVENTYDQMDVGLADPLDSDEIAEKWIPKDREKVRQATLEEAVKGLDERASFAAIYDETVAKIWHDAAQDIRKLMDRKEGE